MATGRWIQSRRTAALTIASGFMAGAPALASAPPASWRSYVDPVHAGFSAERLAEAKAYADESRSAAVVAVRGGNVVAAWGCVDRPLMVRSIRKSLAGALYGLAVRDRRWALDDPISRFGLQDDPPLSPAELQATVRDLLSSRSGVYHGAAYASDDQEADRPARGSHPHGTFWYYNNWDFNAAENLYQRATGEDLYAAFGRRLARPLGMEDFNPASQERIFEPSNSRLPAHSFRLSARDLARFGEMYLRQGRWRGRQVVPQAWVRDSFRPHSETGPHQGYGYLWWVYDVGSLGEAYPGLRTGPVYVARGSGGQAIIIIPSADMVVVHLADGDNGRDVPGGRVWALAEKLVSAGRGPRSAHPLLGPLRVEHLSSGLPAPAPIMTRPLSTTLMERFAGDYVTSRGGAIRVFVFEGRLFMSVPGQGEAEIFATDADSFIVKVLPGVAITFQSDAAGRPVKVLVKIGRQQIEGVRAPPG